MAKLDDKSEALTVNQPEDIAPGEVIIGTLQGLSENAEPLVDFPRNNSCQAIVAMSTLALSTEHIGREVALLFTAGDFSRPLIIGLIHSALQDLIANFETSTDLQSVKPDESGQIEATIDGKKVVIEGQDEVVLKCGESSITLTRSGKIVIRGRSILNRSTGLNRILGGSVQIN